MLQLLIAPVNEQNTRFLDAWAQSEGGMASYNPLNTTYPLPWTTDYNPVHVKNYNNSIEGISATAITLSRDSGYLGLWKDLQNGSWMAEQLVERNRDAISHWGTSPALILKVLQNL